MDAIQRQRFIKQRAVARGMLTRIQNYIEAGDKKLNELQVMFNKLSDIFNRYDTAQIELELCDDTDHSGDRESLKINIFKWKQGSLNYYTQL
jgi:hypothetical protein